MPRDLTDDPSDILKSRHFGAFEPFEKLHVYNLHDNLDIKV